jgi:hypothetical protein
VRLEPAGVKPIVRLVLDNGTSLRLTRDHLVLSMEEPAPVTFCQEGLSVLPLYKGKTTLGYPTFCQQGTLWRQAPAPSDRRRNRLVARMVYEWKSGQPVQTGQVVRYVDGNRMNAHPDNLRIEGAGGKGRVRGTLKNHIRAQKEVARLAQKGGKNHKIVGWEDWEPEETFDLVSDQCSNLAVGEIFVAVTYGSA